MGNIEIFWAGTFYKNNNANTWSDGLRALTEEAKTNKPILFTYYFGDGRGHTIVIKGYQAAADGGHNLLAYDNRTPAVDIVVKIKQQFTSVVVAGSENANQMYFTSNLSGYDNIDIDGLANDMVLATPTASSRDSTDVSFAPNGSAITVTDAAGHTLVYNSATGTHTRVQCKYCLRVSSPTAQRMATRRRRLFCLKFQTVPSSLSNRRAKVLMPLL